MPQVWEEGAEWPIQFRSSVSASYRALCACGSIHADLSPGFHGASSCPLVTLYLPYSKERGIWDSTEGENEWIYVKMDAPGCWIYRLGVWERRIRRKPRDRGPEMPVSGQCFHFWTGSLEVWWLQSSELLALPFSSCWMCWEVHCFGIISGIPCANPEAFPLSSMECT